MRALLSLVLACLACQAQAGPAAFVAAHVAGLAPQPPLPKLSVASPARPAVPLPARSAAPFADLPLRTTDTRSDARARYRALIRREAEGTDLPVEVAAAVAQIESGYDPSVVGSVGEVGLMQVRPGTAAMMGFGGTAAELATPETNVRYGVRYLAQAWRLAHGDLCRALMKYRAGHGAETMSPLSATYCARARAVLGLPQDGPGASPMLATADTPTARPRGPARSFWAAHEARVARIRAQVVASWRARGWRPRGA